MHPQQLQTPGYREKVVLDCHSGEAREAGTIFTGAGHRSHGEGVVICRKLLSEDTRSFSIFPAGSNDGV